MAAESPSPSDPETTLTHTAPALRAARTGAGLAHVSLFTVLEVTGEDRLSFLDAQLPLDLTALSPGSGGCTAFLDRRGRILSDLRILVEESRILLLAPHERTSFLAEALEAQRFRERAAIRSFDAELTVWEFLGPESPVLLARLSGLAVPARRYAHRRLMLGGAEVTAVADPWSGDPGFRLLVPCDGSAAVAAALAAVSPVALNAAALEVLRLEGGEPRFGRDMDERTLLLELDRPEMVTHNRGCYPGQETIARVHARGRVQRVLRGLRVDGDRIPAPGTLITSGEDPVGETLSATRSPSLRGVIALARVRQAAAEPGTVVRLKLGDHVVPARVDALPLYRAPGPAELAEFLYREGLEAFTADRWEEALAKFEKASLMDPHHLAALESAGVCQERLGRREDAAETMRALTDVDPEHVMAWTNLSRYAAEAGNIEEAERLKGHVTFLVWKREAGTKAAERRVQEEAASRRAAMEERVPLFEQVLELDPDDIVARFGLGKILLDLERFEAAAPHFERAVAVQPDYSMAYNHLATCLLRLGRNAEARDVLVRGIEAATRKGDWIPKRDMERKLGEL